MIRRRRIRRIRKLKRRRFIRSVIMLIILVMAGSTMLNLAFAKKSEADFSKVVVRHGDTVWTIAKKHNPQDMDVRELVHEIIRENNIENGMIYAGQELVIPIS